MWTRYKWWRVPESSWSQLLADLATFGQFDALAAGFSIFPSKVVPQYVIFGFHPGIPTCILSIGHLSKKCWFPNEWFGVRSFRISYKALSKSTQRSEKDNHPTEVHKSVISASKTAWRLAALEPKGRVAVPKRMYFRKRSKTLHCRFWAFIQGFKAGFSEKMIAI